MSQVTEGSLFVTGSRPRGRPRTAQPRDQRVTIRLTSPEYDRLIDLSLRHGEPVTSIVRTLLRIRIPRDFSSANK